MSPSKTLAAPLLDIQKIRKDFPNLHQKVHGKPLIYLDNAATTQKPKSVIDSIYEFYTSYNSNVHRGVHYLSECATAAFESSRKKVRDFIHAASEKEIIFVRGATEGINLVASSLAKSYIKQGDDIIITAMEHHSNIVPWQLLCRERGAHLRVVPITDEGEIIFEEFVKLINENTRIISLVHVSNTLGTVNNIKKIIKHAHDEGVLVLVDGAQAVQHMKVDVQDLDCDFYVFSGHKAYGPTGIGVLYGKERILEEMPPFHGGGDMIRTVTFEETTFNSLPYKFEAGTPNVEGAIGIGIALDYLTNLGLDKIAQYEKDLLDYATNKLLGVEGLRIIGTTKDKASVISFDLKGVHPHDIGTMLDKEGIAVRTGHHCTMPLMIRYNLPATTRVSLSFYNTTEEIDACAEALKKTIKMFA